MFQYCTKLASYLTKHVRWEGNLSKRDIRNYYVSLLMDCDNEQEAWEVAEAIVRMPKKVSPRKSVNINPSYNSMRYYNSLEDWQRAQTKHKQRKIRNRRRPSFATPSYRKRHRETKPL